MGWQPLSRLGKVGNVGSTGRSPVSELWLPSLSLSYQENTQKNQEPGGAHDDGFLAVVPNVRRQCFEKSSSRIDLGAMADC